jgi:hypothetical protein
MLNELEKKLTAIVGDAVSTRPHLDVVEAATAPNGPEPGRGLVRVGIAEVRPDGVFVPGEMLVAGNGAKTTRRVLALGFGAQLRFAIAASGAEPDNLAQARQLLLEDMSAVGFALGEGDVRSGKAFRTAAGDPGFRVSSFELTGGTLPSDGDVPPVSGELVYGGAVAIWPPEPAEDADMIVAVDSVLEILPIALHVDDPVVVAGATTTIRIRGVPGSRLLDVETRARGPLALALSVVSDLPPAQRGTIESGSAAAETGLRIVTAAGPEVAAVYRAPNDLGAVRFEAVSVHLATATSARGLFLGSAPILLRPEEH